MLTRLGLADALLAASSALSGLTYTVTSTADGGTGTLRAKPVRRDQMAAFLFNTFQF